MFTLAHELAHLWLGSLGSFRCKRRALDGYRREEVWCNAVAAELLVPLAAFRPAVRPDEPLDEAMRRLARQFKVSTLVILRRLLDAGAITARRHSVKRLGQGARAARRLVWRRGAGGGDFYRTTLSRVGKRFARALVESTLEGQTLYRDAFRMLGVAKTETFNIIGREVGAIL